MSKIILTYILSMYFFYGNTQQKIYSDSISLDGLKTIKIDIKDSTYNFTTDKLGNFYFYKEQEIIKLSPKGDTLFQNSNKTSGNIHFIDVQNPLSILVFYKNQSLVSVLDNTLSEKSNSVDLSQFDMYQVELVSSSIDNDHIWIYNQENTTLLKLNRNLGTTQEIGNLHNLLDIDITPNFMVETNDNLYLNNPETGILVFDKFGTYYKTIPVKGLEKFQIKNNKIYFTQNGVFGYYDMLELSYHKFMSTQALFNKVRIEKSNICNYSGNILSIFTSFK